MVLLFYLTSYQLQYEGLKTSNFQIYVTLFIYSIWEKLFCDWRSLFFIYNVYKMWSAGKCLLSSILKIWNVSVIW